MNESIYMPALCSSWVLGRGKECGKRGSAKYKKEFDAFFNGAIAALKVTGVMSHDRVGQMFFLGMVDRLDDFVWKQHAEYEAREKAAAEVVDSVIKAVS